MRPNLIIELAKDRYEFRVVESNIDYLVPWDYDIRARRHPFPQDKGIHITKGCLPGMSNSIMWINYDEYGTWYNYDSSKVCLLKDMVLAFNQCYTNNTLTMEDVISYET